MYTYEAVNLKGQAGAVIIALLASLIVLTNPFVTVSKADYIDSNSGPIVYNDRVCNLGDPNDHSTSATAFEISTSEQLWEITDCVSNSATIYFELGDDIDVSQATTAPTNSPIGFSTSAVAYSFSGVLDGKNRTISGLDMSSDDYGVGLFNYLHDATISNLVIAGRFVTTTAATGYTQSAGALAMVAAGTLNLFSISNQASVTGMGYVGGLVGYVKNDANIDFSYNTGNVSGSEYSVGGLVGEVSGNANITTTYNTGTITAAADAAGGLVGYVDNDANITSSYNTGPVSGSFNVGGLVGFVFASANIDSSYNTGPVSGSYYVSGLVGEVWADANINSSYNTGPVSGSDYVGGLVGIGNGTTEIITSYNTGTVSAGGNDLDGLVASGTVTTTSAYSSVVSAYVATTPVADMKLASTFAGFDFDNTWGFGSPADNQGFPMLRVFAELTSYFSDFAKFSSNSELVALALSQGTLDPVFTAGTTTYTASVPNAISSITVTPTRADSGASITVEGVAVSSGNASGAISLTVGSNALSIVVTEEDSTTTTYTITVTRAAAEQNDGQSPAQPPAYEGPVIAGAQSAAAGTEVTFTGSRLESVTSAEVGGVQVTIVSALAEALTLEMPSSMPPGTYDLKLQSSFGTLTVQNGIAITSGSSDSAAPVTEVEATDKKLTVGSFRGFIAIYTKGYEGQRLSAKVAGKWLVVESLDESFKGNDHSRTVRRTGSGYNIKVHLYIDREFLRTEELSTK